jgi:hypothetical protein
LFAINSFIVGLCYCSYLTVGFCIL